MSFSSSSAYVTCKLSVKVTLYVILLQLLTAHFLHAHVEDSTSIFRTKPIETLADSSTSLLYYGKYAFKRPLNTGVQELLGNNRIQAIAMMIPSIELRDYGGPGALNLFSIRGLGPLRNSILLDGIPMSSSQTGVFDISVIPIVPGQSIALNLGGGSSTIGSGAMSGILDIQTASLIDTSFVTLQGGLGSFGEETIRLQSGIGNETTSFMVNVDRMQYQGKYPIRFQPTGILPTQWIERQNAGSSKLNVFARVSHQFKEENMKAMLWTSYVKGEKGIPGAVLTGKVEDSEAYLRDNYFMLAGAVQASISQSTMFHLRSSIRTSSTFFRDPFALFAGYEGAKYVFSHKDVFSQAEVIHVPSKEMLIKSGFSVTHAELRGELLQPFAGDAPSRLSGAVYSGMALDINSWDIDAGFRMDIYSDQRGAALSGHIAIAQQLSHFCSVSTKISRDFRVPSFNELYYLNYGTQFLKPETSYGIDVGSTFSFDKINGQLTLYHMQVQDQILAIPISPVQWSARNIGMVWSSGIEASVGVQIPSINGELHCNYAYKSVLDKTEGAQTSGSMLPYVPNHTFSCMLVSRYDQFKFGMMMTSIGERYAILGGFPESTLQSIILINPHTEYTMKAWNGILRLRVEIRNLLDSEYQMILNFPLPGRSYVFLLEYEL